MKTRKEQLDELLEMQKYIRRLTDKVDELTESLKIQNDIGSSMVLESGLPYYIDEMPKTVREIQKVIGQIKSNIPTYERLRQEAINTPGYKVQRI
jgi:hypothetical protein